MKGFIKLSNSLFNYFGNDKKEENLTAKALFVYAYLLARVNPMQTATCAYIDIAKACNIDSKTATRAIDELIKFKLITKKNRYNSRGYIANAYYVPTLRGTGGTGGTGWFKCPREIFETEIMPTDFLVYCFICSKMSADKKQSFPSLTAIHTGTGVSRGRISKAISYLQTYTFLNRTKRHYKKTRAYRHNLYSLYTIKLFRDKGKAHGLLPCALQASQAFQNRFVSIVHHVWDKCKPFLKKVSKRLLGNFCQKVVVRKILNRFRLTSITNKRKNRYTLI